MLSGEAARREKRGRQPLPSRAFSHVRGHLRVSGVLLDGQDKRETARSLIHMSLRSTGKSQQAKRVTDRGIFLHKIRLSTHDLLASHAGVFRGARISSLPTDEKYICSKGQGTKKVTVSY